MAETFPTGIRIGGTVTKSQLEIIKERFKESSLRDAEFNVHDDHIYAFDCFATWGEFPELEEFLKENRIPFDRHTEARYEYNGTVTYFRPEISSEPFVFPADQSGDPYILWETLKQALEESKSLEELKEKIKDHVPINVPPLPPLQVVDSD